MRRALIAERLTVLATPAAKILFCVAVFMSIVSMTAQLIAADSLNDEQTIEVALHAATVATMIFAALAGVYSATTDHRFGITDQRLLSSPQRTPVFIAKSLVAGALGVLYGLAGATAAVVTASFFYAVAGESLNIGDGIVARSVVGIVIASPLYAMVGVAIGTVVRSQPMAMGGTLVWLFVIEPPIIVGFAEVGRWFPGAAGLALTNAPDPALISQPAGALSLIGYTVLLSMVALWRWRESDV